MADRPMYQGTYLNPADVAAGVTPQSLYFRQLSQDLNKQFDRGLITGQQLTDQLNQAYTQAMGTPSDSSTFTTDTGKPFGQNMATDPSGRTLSSLTGAASAGWTAPVQSASFSAPAVGTPTDLKTMLQGWNSPIMAKINAGKTLTKTEQGIANAEVKVRTRAPGGYGTPNYTGGSTPNAQLPTVNTGNSQWDAVANQYLEYIWGRYGDYLKGVPMGLTDDMMKNLTAEVDRQYGPGLANAKAQAESEYQSKLTESQGLYGQALSGYGLEEARAKEDATQQTTVLGRSLQEAQKDMDLSYAGAGRTFGGGRVEGEQKLGHSYQDALGNIQKTQQRTLEDVAGKRATAGIQETGTEQSLAQKKASDLQAVADQRSLDIANAKQNIQLLPSQILPKL